MSALQMAEELNRASVLVIASPMWNFSFPYVLKQYVDIAVQPGINFLESPERPLTADKTLVVVSSSGGSYGAANPRDHLHTYLRDIFGMVGFTRQRELRIQGAAQKPREVLLSESRQRALDIAHEINDASQR